MKLLLVLLFTFSAYAQSPWYFGSGEAVNLTPNMKASTGIKYMTGALDPSAVAVNAPAGSFYNSTSGTVYVKQDAGSSTNWLPIGVAAPSSLSTINGQSGPAVILAAGTAGTDFAISASANTITFDIPSASGSNRGLLTSANWTTFNNKEPAITATTSADYYRGDKTFQPLNKSAVGLSNVDNTSDASKPVSTATQTALNLKADLASPTFTGTVSGITKSMVGLGNVDNTSDANKPVSTAQQAALDLKEDLSNKSTSTSLGASNTLYPSQNAVKSYVDTGLALKEATANKDNGALSSSTTTFPTSGAVKTYVDAADAAKVSGPASVVDFDLVVFDGTTGKLVKKTAGTGFVRTISGNVSFSAAVNLATEVGSSVLPVANGGTGASTLTANYVLLGNGTSAPQMIAPGTAGNMLVSNGTTWASSGVSGTTLMAAPGVTSPKACYYTWGGGTLASPTACTTGTCGELWDSCAAIAVAFNSTGVYDITVANGTFANSTPIHVNARNGNAGHACNANSPMVTNASGGWAGGIRCVIFSGGSDGTLTNTFGSFEIIAAGP